MIVETAPAKINLYLHVGPLRRDGLHDLASLFVFAKDGDLVRVEPADTLSLKVAGPFAASLNDLQPEDNLVFRAAKKLADHCGVEKGASITLEKHLPVAAGVGGGSADAAAVLRALVRLWDVGISDTALTDIAFSLGADIPACLARSPVNVSGAGEVLSCGPVLPPLWTTLVNPRVAMPTGPIFRAFDEARPDPRTPHCAAMPVANYAALTTLVAGTCNDLEPFAVQRAPVIRYVIDRLGAEPGAIAARMSGSGATCFGLFASPAGARRAANRARARGWWAMASALHVR